MPRGPYKRKRELFATPPPVVAQVNDDAPASRSQHLKTPQRSAILAVLYYCKKKEIPYSFNSILEVFNLRSKATVHSVVKSKRARRLQNSDEPDARGAPRELTNQEATSVANYLDDCPFNNKGDPWVTVASKAYVFPKGELGEKKEQ
jgi:hypothetical protein